MEVLLVTGGCGFIGSNFIRYLFSEASFEGRVVNVDKLTYAANPANLEDIAQEFGEDRYILEKVDICDREALGRLFQQYQPTSICHFAAESHVDRSIAEPSAFIQTNILGTYNLLEASRETGSKLKRFHHVSTDEVFGSLGSEGFFTEETSYKPNSPYSASKASSDHLVRAYAKTFGVPVTITNCSNNYGPYQFPEKLIPLMILNAKESKSLPVYGDGMNVRDWLYVRDHCEAIWKVMTDGQLGETYNVGGCNEKPNLEVVREIIALVDELCPLANGATRSDLITFVKDRPGHDRRYAIDCSKIERELGWKPTESFGSGLRKTVSWYLTHEAWVTQIRSGEYQQWIAEHYG